MFSHLKRTDEKKPDVFDQIVAAALRQDEELLDILLAIASIDIEKEQFTPASKLAADGHHQAVKLLINRYQASLPRVAFGYAFSNRSAHADNILLMAKTPAERFAILKALALAYAETDNEMESQKILDLAATPRQRLVLLRMYACGHALRNRKEKVTKTLALVTAPAERLVLLVDLARAYAANDNEDGIKFILDLARELDQSGQLRLTFAIALGSAHGGHLQRAFRMVTSLEMPVRSQLRQLVIRVIARTGDIASAMKLMNEAGLPPQRLTALWCCMATGFAQGGHISATKTIYESTNNPDEKFRFLKAIVYGCALNLHLYQADHFFRLAATPQQRFELLQEMMKGYVEQGHITAAVKLFSLAADETERQTLLDMLIDNENVKELFCDETSALYTLATLTDLQLRSELAARIPVFANFSGSAATLLKKANRVSEIMTTFDLNFWQATNWLSREMQILLLQFPQMLQDDRLNPDMLIQIARHLSLPTLTVFEASDLGHKLSRHIVGDRLRLFSLSAETAALRLNPHETLMLANPASLRNR